MVYIPLIGRILFSILFIFNGFNHFVSHGDVTGYAQHMGVPAPGLAVVVAGIMLLLGGLSILVGYKVKIGSILLAVFLLASAFMVHTFWAFEGQQAQVEMAQFFKNLALAGAALVFFYVGTGPKSIENQGR